MGTLRLEIRFSSVVGLGSAIEEGLLQLSKLLACANLWPIGELLGLIPRGLHAAKLTPSHRTRRVFLCKYIDWWIIVRPQKRQ